MAALTGITAIKNQRLTRVENKLYGDTIAIGSVVYLDATDSKHKLADNNAAVAASKAAGIATTPGVDGDWGTIVSNGPVTIVGATLAVGTEYYVGSTPGTIIPAADLTTGMVVCRLGIASSSSVLEVSIETKGIVHA